MLTIETGFFRIHAAWRSGNLPYLKKKQNYNIVVRFPKYGKCSIWIVLCVCACPCRSRSFLGGTMTVSSVWKFTCSWVKLLLSAWSLNVSCLVFSHQTRPVTRPDIPVILSRVWPTQLESSTSVRARTRAAWKSLALHVVLSLPVCWKRLEPSLCEAVLCDLCVTGMNVNTSNCCRFHENMCTLFRSTLYLQNKNYNCFKVPTMEFCKTIKRICSYSPNIWRLW